MPKSFYMKLAIVTGGTSSEREVAFWSAANVENVLKGRFDLTVYDFPIQIDKFLADRVSIDVVIPVLHGKGGEDGTIQGFFETLGVKYLFSGVEALALSLDKEKAKTIAAAYGINTPQSITLRRGESMNYDHPVVVKPMDGGSTVGIAIAKSAAELEKALELAFQYAEKVLVEDFIEGDEFTVGVVEEDGEAKALPVIQIRAKGFFDFAQKYDKSALAEEICPAPISPELTTKLQAMAVTAHTAFGCRHLSRTDIMVDKSGKPWFLETNSIPGMTETSLWPKALKVSGRDFAEVFVGWVKES